jgi:hypothetical protein
MSSLDGLSGGAKPKEKESKDSKREFPAYKYSDKGKGPLHEAAILDGRPLFLKYEDNEVKLVEKIEEANRIIRPPYSEEYPYQPYEFADIEEIQSLVKQAKSISIDSLYFRGKEIVNILDQDLSSARSEGEKRRLNRIKSYLNRRLRLIENTVQIRAVDQIHLQIEDTNQPVDQFNMDIGHLELNRLYERLAQIHESQNYGGNIKVTPPVLDATFAPPQGLQFAY